LIVTLSFVAHDALRANNRKKFEPFGGMKSAVLAARDNRGPDELLEMSGWNGDTMTSDPDYEIPYVKDLELVFVVFDILYLRNQVGLEPLASLSEEQTSI
jgi:hypothetical protein